MSGSECPLVSGISPKEGLPGTKVTIRGENLGSRKEDITSITICDGSCADNFEYVSSKKLICYTPKVSGAGEIIVITYSGGIGKCTVTFTGLEPEKKALLDPQQESDTWMEEDFDTLARVFSDKRESPIYTRDLTDPLGQSSRKPRAGSENLGDLYPNASASLTDKNFHPVRHLLEKHRYTNFDDLKMGLVRLKREVERNDQAPIQFMRDNLDAFLQCYDHLSDVNSLLLKDESNSQGGTLTDRVEELLRESADRARRVFEDILKSKVRADTTRNALTVLQRYRFLFSLPKNIEKNIKNHEYDMVATDYEKAKSLFSNTQVPIFKRVLEEVEKQIANFREDLRHQLLVLPMTLEQQKKLIKYLLELDCDGDPAWDCIANMFLWVLRLLFTSKEDLQFPENSRVAGELAALSEGLAPASEPPPPVLPPRGHSMGKEGHSRTISDVSHTSTSSYGSQSTISSPLPSVKSPTTLKICGAGGIPALKGVGRGGHTSGPPNRICFVEEVTEILCVTLPDLWKLGQAYLNGKLFMGVALLTENQQKLARKCDSSRGKFEGMVVDIIEIYTNMVNCALFPDAYESLADSMSQKIGAWNGFDDDTLETSGVWLPQTVRRVRECVSSMEGIGLPEKGVTLMRNLAMNVRSLCSDTLFQRAAKDIKVLHEREDWKVQNEEGGVVSSLPVLFEKRVVDVLLNLKEIVNEPYEEMLAELHQELRETAKTHFSVLLEHFLASLDWLAFHSEDDQSEGPCVIPTHEEQQHRSGGGVGEEARSEPRTCRDKHLLILMSNMHYLMEDIIPRIYMCFLSQGYSASIELQDHMIRKVVELDDKVFSAYIKRKSESLSGIIEHGMSVGYFDWEHAGDPVEVRSYVREILMNLVLIHAEVYAVSALIVPRVMHELVNILSKEFLECISEVEAFNVNGVIHGFVELAALEDILEPYLDADSRNNFELSKKHLGSWDIEGDERVQSIVDQFKKKTRLQLKCFRVQADIVESEIQNSQE